MSGIDVDQKCVDAYQNVKNDKSKFVLFAISDDKKRIDVVPESECKYNKNADPGVFRHFVSHFNETECRYALYNCNMILKGNDGFDCRRDKIVFVSWVPDTASIKVKMIYGSSKEALLKHLGGIGIKWHFSEKEELNAAQWIEKLDSVPNLKMTGNVKDFEGQHKDCWDDE